MVFNFLINQINSIMNLSEKGVGIREMQLKLDLISFEFSVYSAGTLQKVQDLK